MPAGRAIESLSLDILRARSPEDLARRADRALAIAPHASEAYVRAGGFMRPALLSLCAAATFAAACASVDSGTGDVLRDSGVGDAGSTADAGVDAGSDAGT